MRKRLWVIGVLLMVSGCVVFAGRDTVRFLGVWWGSCYSIADLERFPETRFLLPDATIVDYHTIDGPTNQSYPIYDSLHWRMQSRQEPATVVQTYRDYLHAQGWQIMVDNPPLQVSWVKGRLRMEITLLSPDRVPPRLRSTDGKTATIYGVMFAESDTGSCPAVPPAVVE